MKFGKEFASQMVPEWQPAYMNYTHLKFLIKQISVFQPNPPPPLKKSCVKKKVTLYRAFPELLTNINPDKEDEVILVTATEENYQTVFLRLSEVGGESELCFFRRLDVEFNKVINFYKVKVAEMVNEAEELSKQMNALIGLRMKLAEVTRETKMHSKWRMGRDHGIDKEHEMVSLGVLNHVKINVASESLISSLKHAFEPKKPYVD